MNKMEYDLACLNEIHEQIESSQGSAKDGGAMEARRKQRRNERQPTIDDGEAIELLKQRGFLQ